MVNLLNSRTHQRYPSRSDLPIMVRNASAHWIKLCVFAVCLSGIIFFYSRGPSHPRAFNDPVKVTGSVSGDLTAGNATLGFQKIITVSRHPSWRTRGLLAAASLTGLQVDIPPQPYIASASIETFRKSGAADGRNTAYGSAVAWMAHLDMIRHIVASNLESALVVEDDIDFGVSIRQQARLLAENVRNFTDAPESDQTPYGKNWDVLWVGHCGERIDQRSAELYKYFDPTRIPTRQYNGWSSLWLYYVGAQDRVLNRGIQTVCTFAYAVTRTGAQKILQNVATGPGEAFDVALANRCYKRVLDCVIVNPELMHHYIPPAGSGYVSDVSEGDGSLKSADEATFESVKGTSPNVQDSARCKALFDQPCPATPSYMAQPNFPELQPFEDQWKSSG